MYLSSCLSGRDNNLNFLRALAALSVVFTHAFGRTPVSEPLKGLLGDGLGHFGVDAFFYISGILICKSWDCRKSSSDFFLARALRIYPALFISNLFFVFIFGALLSYLPISAYFRSPDVWTYLAENSTMLPGVGAQIELPVFAGKVFNIPLWTLPHELQMYGLLVVIGVCGLLRHPSIVVAVALAGLSQLIVDAIGGSAYEPNGRSRFVFFFFLGAATYLYRNRVQIGNFLLLGVTLLLVSTFLVTSDLSLRRLATSVSLPMLVLWLAYKPSGIIRRYNRMGDYSYGIYIYAFPFQQLISSAAPHLTPTMRFLIATAVVLPVAVASWHLIELRALKWRPRNKKAF